jgi:hypothetical protein
LAARIRSLAALKGKGTGSAFFLIVVPFEAGALSSSPEAARIGSLQGAWSRSAEGRSCSISGRTGRAPSRVRALALRPITMLAKTGPGFGADSYLAPEKRGSHWTLLWREQDSNPRSPFREELEYEISRQDREIASRPDRGLARSRPTRSSTALQIGNTAEPDRWMICAEPRATFELWGSINSPHQLDNPIGIRAPVRPS